LDAQKSKNRENLMSLLMSVHLSHSQNARPLKAGARGAAESLGRLEFQV